MPGYLVGGKTGTAEKVENGRYSANKRLNSFLAAFPMDDPQYVVLVVLDEPKPESGRRRRDGRLQCRADGRRGHPPGGGDARRRAARRPIRTAPLLVSN